MAPTRRERTRVGAECSAERATGDRSPRRCRSFVLVEEENRRSPAGREPIEKGRKCADRAGASAAACFRWHCSRLFTPLTPLPSRQVRAELSVFSSTRRGLPLPSHPLSRSTSLRARQDGRHGSAVIFGAENPSTSNPRVSKSSCVARTTATPQEHERTSQLAAGRRELRSVLASSSRLRSPASQPASESIDSSRRAASLGRIRPRRASAVLRTGGACRE